MSQIRGRGPVACRSLLLVLALTLLAGGAIGGPGVFYICGMDGQVRARCCCPDLDEAAARPERATFVAPDRHCCCKLLFVSGLVSPATPASIRPGADRVRPATAVLAAAPKSESRIALASSESILIEPRASGPPLYVRNSSFLI